MTNKNKVQSGSLFLLLVFCFQMSWAAENKPYPIFITDSKFLNEAGIIKQFKQNNADGFDFLTEKGGLFSCSQPNVEKDLKRHFFSNIVRNTLDTKHIPILFTRIQDQPFVTLDADHQLIIGNTMTPPVCDSKPYKLEHLNFKTEGGVEDTLFVVSSSWPNIYFVPKAALCLQSYLMQDMSFKNRVEIALSGPIEKLCPNLESVRFKLKDAYLLSIGQEGDDQYIIYAQYSNGDSTSKNESSIFRYRNVKTDYCRFEIKKIIIKKGCSRLAFERIVKQIEQGTTLNPYQLENEATITKIDSFQDVPVNGLHVPFIIDYKNDKEWAIVCKQKDGYYISVMGGLSGKKISFVDSYQQQVKDSLIAIQVQQTHVKFYCKHMQSLSYQNFPLKNSSDLVSLYEIAQLIVLQKYADNNLLIGSCADSNNVHLLFKQDSNALYEFFWGVKQMSIQSISRFQDAGQLNSQLNQEAEKKKKVDETEKLKRKEQDARNKLVMKKKNKMSSKKMSEAAIRREEAQFFLGLDEASKETFNVFKRENNLSDEDSKILVKVLEKATKEKTENEFYATSPTDQLKWFNEQKKAVQKEK